MPGAVEPVWFCIPCDNAYLKVELAHNRRREWDQREGAMAERVAALDLEEDDGSTWLSPDWTAGE